MIAYITNGTLVDSILHIHLTMRISSERREKREKRVRIDKVCWSVKE